MQGVECHSKTGFMLEGANILWCVPVLCKYPQVYLETANYRSVRDMNISGLT